jgi:hypothetical protein
MRRLEVAAFAEARDQLSGVPQNMVCRTGWHTATVEYACSKRNPSAASLSTWGVRSLMGPPKTALESWFMSSAVKKRMLSGLAWMPQSVRINAAMNGNGYPMTLFSN